MPDTFLRRLSEIPAPPPGNPLDPQWISQLIGLRYDLAQAFLRAAPDQLEQMFKGDAGKAHADLLALEMAAYPAQPFEKELVARILQDLSTETPGAGAVGRILAGMLYEGPHVLLSCKLLSAIPAWFLDGFMEYSLGIPPLFKVEGETESYCRHVSQWVGHLHAGILANRSSAYWHNILGAFLKHACFISVYFSRSTLRTLCQQRAELIEFALGLEGRVVDYAFAPRAPGSGKIRFGVLAASFQPRAETFATLPVYSHLDRRAVEVILIAPAGRTQEPMEAYCASFADRIVEIPRTIVPAVETIRALDLDAIWIATNITALAGLFPFLAAHRLARTQIVGGCCPLTSGFRNVDVFVSGTLTEPPGIAQEHYTEKLVCMDGPFLCFDFGPAGNGQAGTRALDRTSLGIPPDAVVYASGANYFKITPELESVWIRILAASRDSRLLLYPFNPNWAHTYQVVPIFLRMLDTFRKLGVEANRLVVIPPLPTVADIRTTLEKTVDIYLDPFPHSGMTSLIDPLLVGVPTVVLEGSAQRSRMASGALRDLGIPEMITADEEAYVSLAVQLGQDQPMRQRLKHQIKEKISAPPKFLDSAWCGRETTRLLKALVAG